MKLTHRKLREKIRAFWTERHHVEVPAIPLVPQNDPTTLFTGSGMQQLVPYLLGEIHPLGNKLFNIQNCIRVQDIDEVGDNRHDTFFEMIGNWSLGDYFKKEQLQYIFTFLTDKQVGLGLDPKRLYVTVFKGAGEIRGDDESIEVWKNIFKSVGIDAKIGERIYSYGPEKNWWSRAGVPDNMPPGEPGGPDSEIFYKFEGVHDKKYGDKCHPNCDCGVFMEIGNSVFMQYKKTEGGTFEPLPKMNVDFGGGLERLLAACQNDPDGFKSDVFSEIIKVIEKQFEVDYSKDELKPTIRIIADHLKTATFIIQGGVYPSNKEQGYVLRRLLRRALVKIRSLNSKYSMVNISPIISEVIKTYDGIYFDLEKDLKRIIPVIEGEIEKFNKTLSQGMKMIDKLEAVDARAAFDLYQTYGFPLEITEEILKERGLQIVRDEFYNEFNKHKELSRTSSSGKFKGGLADHTERTIKYHTATHLIHQALFDVMGNSIRQEGSNITSERLRFDYFSEISPSPEDIKKVEDIVNKKIAEALPVQMSTLDKTEAEKLGARSFFKEKYGDHVNVYYIGGVEGDIKNAYSKEFCGGPHVKNTSEIGEIKIIKTKKIGSNIFRIYAE